VVISVLVAVSQVLHFTDPSHTDAEPEEALRLGYYGRGREDAWEFGSQMTVKQRLLPLSRMEDVS
jgi:hypothetical protein